MLIRPTYAAVLFDCDGVLVDSERITNTVLRAMLHELGWVISVEDCLRLFVGKMFRDEAPLIAKHTGFWIDDVWMAEFRARRDIALQEKLRVIPGAVDAVRAVALAYPDRIACASSADRPKIEMQLRKVGLYDVFAGRIFSGLELEHSKPAPDVYLAAASALGIDPAEAAVIEDSPTGVRAGHAAGAHVFGYSPDSPVHHRPEQLLAVGADETFADMADLPDLLTESVTEVA